jgi:hypothetical protein
LVHSHVCSKCETVNCHQFTTASKIIDALKENQLNTVPLYILLACEYFQQNHRIVTGNIYTLISQFYERQLRNTLNSNDDIEKFYNRLGWFCLKNDSKSLSALQLLNSMDSTNENDISIVNNRPIELMSLKETLQIALDSGIVYSNGTAADANVKYAFVYSTTTNFAAARFLYNSQLWRIVSTIEWEMTHYFLLMHSLSQETYDRTLRNDNDLWMHQVTNKSPSAVTGWVPQMSITHFPRLNITLGMSLGS